MIKYPQAWSLRFFASTNGYRYTSYNGILLQYFKDVLLDEGFTINDVQGKSVNDLWKLCNTPSVNLSEFPRYNGH